MACSLFSQLSHTTHFTQNRGKNHAAMPYQIRFNESLTKTVLILLILIYIVKIIMLHQNLLVSVNSIYLRNYAMTSFRACAISAATINRNIQTT